MGRVAALIRLSIFLLVVTADRSSLTQAAQDPNEPAVSGYVTAVKAPNEFSVQRARVVTSSATQFVFLGGPTAQSGQAPREITVGMYVAVFGTKDYVANYVTADVVKVRNEAGEAVSGFGVIDRVLTAGAQPRFRADGYVLNVNAETEVNFTGDITALSQVNTNIWVRYKGRWNDSGEIVLSRADFLRRKIKPPKRDPHVSLAQATVFPPRSVIDFDGSLRTGGGAPQDQGGACGWYPVSLNAALQERVRRIGFSVIPQYQRELPDNDPAKIPFRFYAVEEKDIHSYLGCGNEGLVLVSADAVARLQNDDQLAALLADRVALNLQSLQGRLLDEAGLAGAASAAMSVGGPISTGANLAARTVLLRDVERKLLEQRGRMLLGYMADAGYDPWQAPEAWRLLAPSRLPKDLSKLKYPAQSEYELGILQLEYKRPSRAASAPAPAENK